MTHLATPPDAARPARPARASRPAAAPAATPAPPPPRAAADGRERRRHPGPPLLAAAGGAGVLVAAALAWSARTPVARLDRIVARAFGPVRRHRRLAQAPAVGGRATREHTTSEAVGGLTGQWPTLAAGSAAAAAVAWRRGARPALPVLAAVPLAIAAHGAVKYGLRRPRPLAARLTGKHTPSFPSGHAARGAAIAGILGHVASREGVLRPAVAFPLGAAAAAAGGASRVYVERHWATDVVGGWGLGAAVAALCALWYDRARR